ncbi:tetratricopeptide repeat protein [Oceanobacillus rekensis]|uniref:tetratricopeptide repeat protein n=1 Tax=Oceanobacillus rekensis TaxID=937927 RepID=UPI0011228146|nr:tetratricopeptide repeat protein [Oceanobacillus rekensis]
MINETYEAIDYLEKTYEKSYTYLNEAIPMFKGSPLANKLVHAEAYIEMAYNYFDQSQLNKAIPYYEKAIVQLEKTNDQELLENALADVIAFFSSTDNLKKKRLYENKFVKMTNEKSHIH